MALDAEPNLPDRGPPRGPTQALSPEARTLAAIRSVEGALGPLPSVDELLPPLLLRLQELVKAERVELLSLDQGEQMLVGSWGTTPDGASRKVPVGRGLVGRVASSGRLERVDDATRDPRFDSSWDALPPGQARSVIAIPLKNEVDRIVGVLEVVGQSGAAPFTEEDEACAVAFGKRAAEAIEEKRIVRSRADKELELIATRKLLERRVRDLELLFELERSTARATSHEELAQAVLGRFARACNARAAGLLLRDEETRDLIEYTLDVESVGLRARGPVTDGILFRVATTNAHLERSPSGAASVGELDAGLGFPVETLIAEPLEGDDGALGALGLFNKAEGQPFSEEDLRLLRLMSANLSTAVRLFDVNRAREREERLTTVGRLLSQVIHDFRSPMTVISGYVQLMEESDDPAQRRRYAEEILQQFQAVASMQREVLAFARGESDLFLRRVYVDRFCADLARQLRHELTGKRIELTLDIEPKLVARFDAERMSRALFNLARNAVEAMGEAGGRLTLRVRRREVDLIFLVEDTGPGIPEAIRARLFQSFVTANKPGGTGLGLAIVKRIVEQHGGTVSVSSSPRGACFELRVPGHFEAQEPPKSIEPPAKAIRGGQAGRAARPVSRIGTGAGPKSR